MLVLGLQKLTLLDYPGKTACTIFTGGCNLRCPYCHNALIVEDVSDCEPVDEKVLFDFLKKRRGVLDGVCITGGEPLIQNGIHEFISRIKKLGYLVKLDTNGCFPQKLKELVDDNLIDYVAMDLKSSINEYSKATGVDNIDKKTVCESINFLLKDNVDYEFRTTVVKGIHNQDILLDAAKIISGAKRYYLQKFVDSGNILGKGVSAFSDDEMRAFLETVTPFVEHAELRGI